MKELQKECQCNLCGSKNHSFLFSNYDRMLQIKSSLFNLYQCKICGLIFINPQPSNSELTTHYDKTAYSVFKNRGEINDIRKIFILFETLYNYCSYKSTKYVFFFLLNILFLPIKSFFRTTKIIENGKYLDVGCGNGYFLLTVKYLGMEVYGVEPGDFDREFSDKFNLKIYKGDLFEAQFEDNFFDVITLNHVLEHVNDPSKTIAEIYRILKPNGYLIINTPISDSWAFKIFGKYWAQLDTPRHLFLFSDKNIKNYAKKYNFEISKVRYCSKPSFQIIGSIIYYLEDKTKFFYNRMLIHNIFLNILLLPISALLNLIKKGDQCEYLLLKK